MNGKGLFWSVYVLILLVAYASTRDLLLVGAIAMILSGQALVFEGVAEMKKAG